MFLEWVKPLGMVSTSWTPVARDGPLFVIVTNHSTSCAVAGLPGKTKPGPYWGLKALLLLVTAMSMRLSAVVVADFVLFAATESVSPAPTATVAVSVIVAPSFVDGSTATTRVNGLVVLLPARWTPEFVVQVMAPVPPTAGVVQLQPEGGVIETNVVLDGTFCENVTVAVVADVLRFETVCEYVMLLPALTGSGESAFVVTSRSSAQVTCSVELLVVALQLPFVDTRR